MSQRHRTSLVALTTLLIASVLLPGATAQGLDPQGPAGPGSAPQTAALERAASLRTGLRLYLPIVGKQWTWPPGPTSDQLIDQALARGEINAETALTYKVFATFGDARLPAAFKGDDRRLVDSHIISEVQARYGQLSAATRAVLDSFLIPPVYEGSWADTAAGSQGPASQPSAAFQTAGHFGPDMPAWTPPKCEKLQAGKWDHADGVHARFWWRKSQPELFMPASRFIRELDGTIWPALTKLLGRAPLPDTGNACGGGNDKLDVYLDRSVARSYAAPHNSPGCHTTSAFIVLNPGVSNSILTHEFMHTIQFGYTPADGGCMYPGEYAWLMEATAMWAEDFVYPKANEEQYTAEWFFAHQAEPSLELKNDAHEYGAYLFFFFAVRRMDDPDLVHRVWDNVGAMKSLEAVDAALPQGFDWWWDEFAKANVNVPPYNDYEKWDGQMVRPASYNGDMLVKDQGTWPLDADVPHLGLIYHRFKFTGDEARLVTFTNGLTKELGEEPIEPWIHVVNVEDGTQKYKWTDRAAEEVKDARIYGFFKIEGVAGWQYEDWTNAKWVSFCRDAKAERLEELVIVFSYKQFADRSKWVKPADQRPALQVSDMGCWRYKGTADFEAKLIGAEGMIVDVQKATGVTFDRREAHPNIPYPFQTFELKGGQLDRSYTISGKCSGHETFTAAPVAGAFGWENSLYTISGATQGPSVFRYLGWANPHRNITLWITCPDPPGSGPGTFDTDPFFSPTDIGILMGTTFIAKPGGSLQEQVDFPLGGGGSYWKWAWTLLPEREK